MINIGALKVSAAGGRGLWFPQFLVCGGKINLEVFPCFIGVCFALPDFTVVVEETSLEDYLIGRGDNLCW